MKKSSLIDEVVTTQKTNENVRRAIPILIRWAQQGDFSHTYGDLMGELGYSDCRHVGHLLGAIQEVLDALSEREGQNIPTLNTLCKNKETLLPSDGFTFVISNYKELDIEVKKSLVRDWDTQAHTYPRWAWVMEQLGLHEASPVSEEQLAAIGKHSYGGGEGAEHKRLKEYILHHPEEVGIRGVVRAETEHVLPSGDRLDVYFELKNGDRIAVEVKPQTAPEDDVNRGIFQCVKYDAILHAIRTLRCEKYNISTLLVIGGALSKSNQQFQRELHIDCVEHFAEQIKE